MTFIVLAQKVSVSEISHSPRQTRLFGHLPRVVISLKNKKKIEIEIERERKREKLCFTYQTRSKVWIETDMDLEILFVY